MDDPSQSASALEWLWVIEALAGFKEISTPTLQDLIDVAPVRPDDFCKKTRELVALRCLEDLFSSAHRINCDAPLSLDSRVGFDFSRGCEDVLQQILHELSISNLKMAEAELLKWDILPYITHKRASTVKCDLEQLKESIFDGAHPYTDYFKERSGLALQNGVYPVLLSGGECNDLPEKDNGNCTYAANMGAKENSVSIVLENGNESSKEHLLDKNFSSSKRNRIESADEHVMGYLHENQVHINECDGFLRNAKKIKCGEGMLENSTEKTCLVFEREGCHSKKDIRETLQEGSFEDSHDKCTASNQCRSSSHNEFFHDESNIPFSSAMMPQHTSGGQCCQQQQVESIPTNVPLPDRIQHKFPENCLDMSTTMMLQHTSGDEPCQNTSLNETKYDTEHHIEPIPANVDDPCKIPNMSNESQSKRTKDFQLKEPNAASLDVSKQPVASDKAVDDTVNGCESDAEMLRDSDEYHDEKIDLEAKKHEFLSSQCACGHDFSASTEWTENNLCMKCNEGGQLLVCKTNTCPLVVHKSCLGTSCQFGPDSNFFCPFCAYSHAISEYLQAKKKVSLARKELAIFICKDNGHQNTGLHEFHRKEHNVSRKSSEYEHILDKRNGGGWLSGREDNKEDRVGEHVNEVNNLQSERSQQQAFASCVNSSCREREIVNNGVVEGLGGEEESGKMLNFKSSTGTGVEENQVPADHVGIDDNFSCEEANQSNTREEMWQEMLNTGKEEISRVEHEKPIISRYFMRSRKCEIHYKPKAIPLSGRKQISWTAEEEELIREGVLKFGSSGQKIPWKKILEFGSHVFEKDGKHRTPQDLKDKWKNMRRAHSKSK